jgi:hypothetical protein
MRGDYGNQTDAATARATNADEAGTVAAGAAKITALFDAAVDEIANENEEAPNAPSGQIQVAEATEQQAAAGAPAESAGTGERSASGFGTDAAATDQGSALFDESDDDAPAGTSEAGATTETATAPQNQQASFTPGPGPEILPGIGEEGPIDPTALQYRVPDFEQRPLGDDNGRGNGGSMEPAFLAQNDVLRIQEGSEGTGNQPIMGERYEFSQQLGIVGPLPHQWTDNLVDGYRFAIAAASVDAANGLLANDGPDPTGITSIAYVGNNDGSLGTIIDSFDALENRMTFSAEYGGEPIWTIVFDLDDGSYEFTQHHAYAHLGTPGDVLEESFLYESTDAMGNLASATFALQIVDDTPTTADFDFFLTDIVDGTDGDSGVIGNLLTGGLGADNRWFDPNVGPTGTGYEAFYGVDINNDDAPDHELPVQVFDADNFGADDDGHIYSVSYEGVTYQRIWTGTGLDPNSVLHIEIGVETILPLTPYVAGFGMGSQANADAFGMAVVLVEDIMIGTPEGTLFAFNYWDLEASGTPAPFSGTLTYEIIDGDGDISAPRDVSFLVVDVNVYFGTPMVEAPPTLDNLDQYLG